MKNNHILNIGYPKCGTTWCWELLTQQPWFSAPREKENTDLEFRVPLEKYIDSYVDHDITANFNPRLAFLDRYLIKQLSELSTVQASIILRNSFDLLWSLYNFGGPDAKESFNESVKNIIEQGWFHRPAHVIKRWQEYFTPDRFHIFYYDDIQKNNNEFFKNYCSKMQLPSPTLKEKDITVNKTRYIYLDSDLSPKVVKIINQEIDNLQDLLKYDLSTWKK